VEQPEVIQKHEIEVNASAQFSGKGGQELVLRFVPDGKSNLTIGRSKENNLNLDDVSVSKLHASLVMDAEGKLRVADIGSTNGTFLKGERIAYGKAYDVLPGDSISFGEVPVIFNWEIPEVAPEENAESVDNSGDEEHEEAETAVNNEAETMVKTSEEPETVFKSRESSVKPASETEADYVSMSDFTKSAAGLPVNSSSVSETSPDSTKRSD
ncbi:MAG TPA: FHA domain-containing protein, partial [Pyrinomonadaceae bacterium]|nr:FHA domain-containing protein [Pyrinomonadaceae bacterium]